MKQVPNPLPKVLSRRGVGAGMEAAERESFERTQVRTGGPRVAHGWGIPRDAVSWSGLEGSRGLADPGKDRARGPRERASGAQVGAVREGRGPRGHPAGLGKRAGRLRGADMIRAARLRGADPGGARQGSQGR